jgi:hypothetical protein
VMNLANGFIQQLSSLAAAYLLIGEIHDCGLRQCIDYLAVNLPTVKFSDAIPLVSQILHVLYGARMFSLVDLINSYPHVRIKEGRQWTIPILDQLCPVQTLSHALQIHQHGSPILETP